MNMLKFVQALVVTACIWHFSGSAAQCALTRPTLTLEANPSNVQADYRLGDGGHMLFFNLNSSGTISTVTFTLGGGFAFYAVDALTVFDVNYAQTHTPFSGNTGGGPGTLATPFNVPFYLGYYVQSGNPSPTINANSNDGYGWAELIRNANGLSLLDSALQFPSGGIIVGTTTAVPEPACQYFLALGALMSLGFGLRRKGCCTAGGFKTTSPA